MANHDNSREGFLLRLAERIKALPTGMLARFLGTLPQYMMASISQSVHAMEEEQRATKGKNERNETATADR